MANVQNSPHCIPALPEVGRQDLDINVNHVTLADRIVIPCTSKNYVGHTLDPGGGIQSHPFVYRCRWQGCKHTPKGGCAE